MFLTKTCIVGSGSADEAREETEDKDEMLLERMLGRMIAIVLFVRCGIVSSLSTTLQTGRVSVGVGGVL